MNVGAYFSAFALALTIPDILSKIDYPDIQSVGDRYELWMNENYVEGEKFETQFDEDTSEQLRIIQNQLDGELYYQIRNAFLHAGNTDIRSKKKSVNLELTLTDCSSISILSWSSDICSHVFVLSIPDFCCKMSAHAKYYYKKYKDNQAKKSFLDESKIVIEY